MIHYIQRKQVDVHRVKQFLSICDRENHYTNAGPIKRLLEDKIGQLIDIPSTKRVLCVANGTVALHALMQYYNKLHGKQLKWVTPAFTFPSCVTNNSNTTILDIDNDTYTLSLDDINDIDNADGIIITNLFGTIVDFDTSKFPGKIIIYDNASSFLSFDEHGSNICLSGNASFSSLHHTKSLGFGEGGFMVIDTDMYDDMQALCGFGFKLGDKNYDVASSNYKMSDVAAAYILQHIENYNINQHLDNQELFRSLINLPLFNDSHGTFYGNLPVVFPNPTDPVIFRSLGIEANKYYKPLLPMKNSNDLYDRIINFPLYADMTKGDIKYISNAINKHS